MGVSWVFKKVGSFYKEYTESPLKWRRQEVVGKELIVEWFINTPKKFHVHETQVRGPGDVATSHTVSPRYMNEGVIGKYSVEKDIPESEKYSRSKKVSLLLTTT